MTQKYISPLKKSFIIGLLLMLISAPKFYGQVYSEIIKAVASDRAENDAFGYAVAISGDYAIIGTPNEDEDALNTNTLTDAGSAYIYEKDGGGNWVEVQKIVPSDRAGGDQFGFSVSISGDYVIIGAPNEDEDTINANTTESAGSAYIFERDGSGNWMEEQKIVASDRMQGDEFGFSVAISGTRAVVGAPLDDVPQLFANRENSGSAYFFELDSISNNWMEVLRVNPILLGTNFEFGFSVGISDSFAIVGAPHEQPAFGFTNLGTAYIYTRDTNDNWFATTLLTNTDFSDNDEFGFAVAISDDYAVAGAHLEDEDENMSNTLSSAGSAYIFERNGSSWNNGQKIVASDRDTNDQFGSAVAISGDQVIIGAPFGNKNSAGNNELNNAGSAYIFERDGSGNWNEEQKIVAPDRTTNDEFGFAVAISGNQAIVGAQKEDDDTVGINPLSNAGSAYIFGPCTGSTTAASAPIVTGMSPVGTCPEDVTLTITGSLNDAINWNIYTDSCGGTLIGTTINSSFVVRAIDTTEYFVRGEGGCVIPGGCDSILINAPEDNIPPVFDNLTLSDTVSNCPITLTPPTATDNCTGAITATANVIFPISAIGATVVTWTYDDDNGNIATQDQNVTINASDIDATIFLSGGTLTVINNPTASYQWVTCFPDTIPIAGETGISYTPTELGAYGVIITLGQCSEISNCRGVMPDTNSTVGIDENNIKKSFNIHPNPTNGSFELSFNDSDIQSYQLSVINTVGQVVYEEEGTQQKTKINLEGINKGVYYVKITSENNDKFVVEKIIVY